MPLFGRKPPKSPGMGKGIEMTAQAPRREIETDYQPVNWKRLFLAPKYLGMRCAGLRGGRVLTRVEADWIGGSVLDSCDHCGCFDGYHDH